MKEKILEYFNDTFKSKYAYCGLKVLDNKYKVAYTGVTLNYITYKLLKAKYKKKDVAKCLLELHQQGKISSLYCKDVQNYVFENRETTHWNFNRNTGKHEWFSKYNLHKYLNKFIKNE